MVLLAIITVVWFVLLDEITVASVQRRTGPFVQTSYGLLTPVISALGLFFTTNTNTKPLEAYVQLIIAVTILSAVFPLWQCDTLFSLLLLFILSSMHALALIRIGYKSTSKWARLAAHRLVLQLLAFELVWAACLILWAGIGMTFNITSLPALPFHIVLWGIMCITTLGLSNRSPFDWTEAESELGAGLATTLGSVELMLLILGEYIHILALTLLIADMFGLGLFNTAFLLTIFSSIRMSLPRVSLDRALMYSWGLLIPLVMTLFIIVV